MSWIGTRSLLGVLVGVMVLGEATPSAASGPPAPIWSGVYVGIHGGHANADVGYTLDFKDSGAKDQEVNHSASGLFGGGHVGVQRQWGRVVGGVEASYSALDLSDTAGLKQSRFSQLDIDDLFTLTVRLGYAFDRWMPYVKAGYASAKVDTSLATAGLKPSAISGQENGWTVGAGVEFFRGRGLVFGLEYNYVRLDLDDRSGLLADYCKDLKFNSKDFDSDIHAISARLSYKFGDHEQRKPLK